MKKLLFCLFAIILILKGYSQSDSIPKNSEGNYEYSEVVSVDSTSAQKLYSNAKIFVVTAFKSGKAVTQMNDDASKTVAGNGTDQIVTKGLVGSAVDKFILFRILIQCKDGRYRYTITNFKINFTNGVESVTYPLEREKAYNRKILTKKQTAEVYSKLNSDMQLLIEKLKNTMASKTENTQDW